MNMKKWQEVTEMKFESIIVECIGCMKAKKHAALQSFVVEIPEDWVIRPYNWVIGACPEHDEVEWKAIEKELDLPLNCKFQSVCGQTTIAKIKTDLKNWKIIGDLLGICPDCRGKYEE